MTLDRQRIRAVELLTLLGYIWRDEKWVSTGSHDDHRRVAVAEGMRAVLMDRLEALAGCTEGSDEESELVAVCVQLDEYETILWPEGKIIGGKG